MWNPQLFFIPCLEMDLVSCKKYMCWRHTIRISRGARLLSETNQSYFVYWPHYQDIDPLLWVLNQLITNSTWTRFWRAQPKLSGTPITSNINVLQFYYECRFLPGTTITFGWLLRRKLNGTTTRQSPNWKPRIAIVDGCLDLVGSRQHGVAAKKLIEPSVKGPLSTKYTWYWPQMKHKSFWI